MKSKLKILPFQIIELKDRLVLKRGLSSLAIPDKSALIIIKVIQKALLQSPKTIDEISSLFSGAVKGLIENFIQHLINKHYIVKEEDSQKYSFDKETPQDIFYWHFNTYQNQVAEMLGEKKWAFVGINELNKKMIQVLFGEGKNNFIVVDDPSLRNVKYFNDSFEITDDFWRDSRIVKMSESDFVKNPDDIGFVIASSEFGSFFLLENWNSFSLKNKIPFYPILLQNMVGYVGPLVIADEGACLTCLKLRQNSTSSDFEEKRMTEEFAFQGQKIVAYHQSMLNVLAEVGAFNLIKFKANIKWDLGSFHELDLLGGNMERRRLLKAPRCPSCSSLNEIPFVNIHKQLTSDEAWKQIEQLEQIAEYDE